MHILSKHLNHKLSFRPTNALKLRRKFSTVCLVSFDFSDFWWQYNRDLGRRPTPTLNQLSKQK